MCLCRQVSVNLQQATRTQSQVREHVNILLYLMQVRVKLLFNLIQGRHDVMEGLICNYNWISC